MSVSEKIEQAALLAMMIIEGDKDGVAMLVDVLSDAVSDTPLKEKLDALNAEDDGLASEEYLESLRSFITDAQAYARDPESVSSAADEPCEDLDPLADREFIGDFIEKHRMMMDELEAEVLELDDSLDTFGTQLASIKAYLHTVKGDAGSVGLLGVARVTHEIEEQIPNLESNALITLVLSFREWVVTTMCELEAGNDPSISSSAYLSQLSSESGATPVAEAEITEEEQDEETKDITETEATQTNGEDSPPVSLADYEWEGDCIPLSERRAKASELVGQPYEVSGGNDLLQEFLSEAEEHLSNAEEVLLSTEEKDKEAIDTIFRAVHSVKGGSAYFNLEEVMNTSHHTETMMDAVRGDKLKFTPAMQGLLLRYTELTKQLFQSTKDAMTGNGEIVRCQEAADYLAQIEDYVESLNVMAELGIQELLREAAADVIRTEVSLPAPSEQNSKAKSTAAPVKQSSTPISKASGTSQAASPEAKTSSSKMELKSFVKVDTQRLDKLIDSIGEMIIYSSMLVRTCRDHLSENEFVSKTCHQVETFSRELQEVGMSMRLVPIKGLFQKLSRVVWDTSKKLEKDIDFRSVGEDTELDRTLVDKLADPLMHMVRNAVDHGIEMPAERVAAGKPAKGSVELHAYHSGGSILIEIHDDGKGLDPEFLLGKAIEKGIIQPGQRLSEQECFQLIFAPGFSTAAEVTDISGRGVGMDVVRRNIESVRGRIHVESEIGKGSIFRIEVPLTLAIIDGVEARIGDQRFIVPTLSTVELISPDPSMLQSTLEQGETFLFRGKYLPVYRLSNLFEVQGAETDPCKGVIVVAESKGEHFAILVDRIVGQHSTVIKSLGSVFEAIPGIAGCAIMSDGQAALILDVGSLLTFARTEENPNKIGIPTDAISEADAIDVESAGEQYVH